MADTCMGLLYECEVIHPQTGMSWRQWKGMSIDLEATGDRAAHRPYAHRHVTVLGNVTVSCLHV